MATEEVRIPDIGDAGDVEVIEVLVAEGDTVAVDDSLIVLESDKASMDVPSTVAGRISAVRMKVGDKCTEGDVVVEVETEAAADDSDDSDDSDGSGATAGYPEGESDDGRASSDDDDDDDGDDDAEDDAAGGGGSVEDVSVPDIGEAGDVVVIEVLVAAGDTVAVDEGLVVLESDKATMEVPSTVAGTVESVALKEGDSVTEGTLVARVKASGGASSGGDPSKKKESSEKQSSKKPDSSKSDTAEAASAKSDGGKESSGGEASSRKADAPTGPTDPPRAGAQVYAGPAVRRLARELGVDLTKVEGSAPKGRIVKEDVHAFVKSALRDGGGASAPAAGGSGIPPIPAQDFSKFGEIETVDVSRIMKTGAANLHRSWLNVPHVTQHDEADVTELEGFRKALKPEAERAGVKVTPLPFLMKVAAAALAEFPRFNGSFTDGGERYVLKKYFHIGFAVDTPDGLLVPVVRDVDRKGVFEISEEIVDLSTRAREKKLKPDEMRGGCFSLSSLGNIGGTGFTPIVNAPEVAILGVSRLATKPVWNGSDFAPRQMLPLSLSYDHKAINGAEAGRFLTWYVQALADVRRLLL